MGLSGSRLNTTLTASFLAQLQAKFPVDASLKTQEKIDMAAAQQKLAEAFGNSAGPDVVSEITTNAVVPGVMSGGSMTVVT